MEDGKAVSYPRRRVSILPIQWIPAFAEPALTLENAYLFPHAGYRRGYGVLHSGQLLIEPPTSAVGARLAMPGKKIGVFQCKGNAGGNGG